MDKELDLADLHSAIELYYDVLWVYTEPLALPSVDILLGSVHRD